MTNWTKVFGTQAEPPQELDTTSSPTTVYQRRNIKQESRTEDNENIIEGFSYEERELSLGEYQRMHEDLTSPATQMIMQEISDLQLQIALLEVREA